jgi:hypothetical protein
LDNEIKLFEGNQIRSVVSNPKVFKKGGNVSKVIRKILEKETR